MLAKARAEEIIRAPLKIKKAILDKEKTEVYLKDEGWMGSEGWMGYKEGFHVYGSYLHPESGSFENYPLHIEHELFDEWEDTHAHSYMVRAKKINSILSDIFAEPNKLCRSCDSCCCRSCASNHGYFYENTPKQVRIRIKVDLAKYHDYIRDPYYNEKRGYLNEDGCVLPWWLRSSTCLSYTCFRISDKMSYEDKSRLENTIRILTALKLRVGLPY